MYISWNKFAGFTFSLIICTTFYPLPLRSYNNYVEEKINWEILQTIFRLSKSWINCYNPVCLSFGWSLWFSLAQLTERRSTSNHETTWLCIADGKECDALVCYHEKDSSLVIGIVIPTLESRHRYKCAALELSQLNHNCKYARPLLALISGDDACLSLDNYVVTATATMYLRNTRVPLRKVSPFPSIPRVIPQFFPQLYSWHFQGY